MPLEDLFSCQAGTTALQLLLQLLLWDGILEMGWDRTGQPGEIRPFGT